MMSEEALQIAEKRREVKGKEIRKHLMWTKQEVEENNRMEKTRDLFNKIGDVKGAFQAKMGTTKDRNGKDLTEKKILRRCGKNK